MKLKQVLLWGVLATSYTGLCLAASADGVPEFEARGTIQQVDSARTAVVVDGLRYELAEKLQVYGTDGGRFELRPGQYVSFETDSGRNRPTITAITVMPE